MQEWPRLNVQSLLCWVEGKRPRSIEHMTPSLFLYPSRQGKGRMKNCTERCFLEEGEKRADMKEQQTHWQRTSTYSTLPYAEGVPIAPDTRSALWAGSIHLPPCSLRRSSARTRIYTVDLHQKFLSISVGTAVSTCKSKWIKPGASNGNVDVLVLWDHVFLQRSFLGKDIKNAQALYDLNINREGTELQNMVL